MIGWLEGAMISEAKTVEKILRFSTVQLVLGEDILVREHKVSQPLFTVDIKPSAGLKLLKGDRGGT